MANIFKEYESQLDGFFARMTRIYEETSTFQSKQYKKRHTKFKINYAFNVENKTLPRLVANSPVRRISYKDPEWLVNPDIDTDEITEALEDYLHDMFTQENLATTLRLRAKTWVRYGMARAKTSYKYDINRKTKKKEVPLYNEQWETEDIEIQSIVEENVGKGYPCMELKNITDVYFDPRYTKLEDMPAIIDLSRNVRLAYFTQNSSKFMNIDKLVQCCQAGVSEWINYRQTIENITGIQILGSHTTMTPKTLEVKCFYGYYDMSDKDDAVWEKLYEFWTVNDAILVYAKEISVVPFECFRVFEDTDTFFATGFTEPILSLQDEINYKKNKASEYINTALNRQYIWSPNSGIDPRKIADMWPGAIIPTTRSAQEALANFTEIPHRQLPSDLFAEQQDFERQIQSLTYTIDVAKPMWADNTATEAKIKSFETNSVLDEVRKHFEDSMKRLAYKLLQIVFENTKSNIKLNKKWEGKLLLHSSVIEDALLKYDIKIETGSSSFDSKENKRQDATALWNIAQQAKALGVPVDLKKMFERLVTTFDDVDKDELYDMQSGMVDMTQWGDQWMQWGEQAMSQPAQEPIQGEVVTNWSLV